MNLYEWHWARLKRDLDLQNNFMPKGTIVRGKSVQLGKLRSPITFIEHSNNVLDTFYISYESLLEPLEK